MKTYVFLAAISAQVKNRMCRLFNSFCRSSLNCCKSSKRCNDNGHVIDVMDMESPRNRYNGNGMNLTIDSDVEIQDLLQTTEESEISILTLSPDGNFNMDDLEDDLNEIDLSYGSAVL